MPLYRQQDELARGPTSLISRRHALRPGSISAQKLFKPLVELNAQGSAQVGSDPGGTRPRYRVLDRARDSTRKGYIWTTIGDRAHPYTTFHYTDSRRPGMGPAEFLKGLRGLPAKPMPTPPTNRWSRSPRARSWPWAAWAHVRREFFDARPQSAARSALRTRLESPSCTTSRMRSVAESDQERLAARQGSGACRCLSDSRSIFASRRGLAVAEEPVSARRSTYALNQWEACAPVRQRWPARDR